MAGNSYVVQFLDAAASEHALVGGKAASLGRLVGAGMPVPAGFSVSTVRYREFMTALQAQVTAILADADYSHAAHLEQQAQAIRTLVCTTPMPAELAAAICAAYGGLSKGAGGNSPARVAVRSSGTAEDLAEASFAGLHDTFLDVESPLRQESCRVF